MEKVQHKISGKRIFERAEELASCSCSSIGVTRLPFTEESAKAGILIEKWMNEAGMTVRKDGLNNIIGRYEGENPDAPILIIGSHLDTVIEGGKYDGMLGVITGIEVVQSLFDSGIILDHPIEVVGFCDEEGVRFHSTFLGSRAIAGTLTDVDLERKDEDGISIAEALKTIGINPLDYLMCRKKKEDVLGYLELHIEQGPVLENENQSVGVVSGIAGATRFSFEIEGKAGHAGTVPIELRQDALVGAAELIQYIESVMWKNRPLVATVGKLLVHPGASNVIPSLVKGTLDIRDIDKTRKESAIHEILIESKKICKSRGLQITFEKVMEADPVVCSDRFNSIIEAAIIQSGGNPIKLFSGAGHDAMAMADITEVAMIFVRCKDGLSHHPDECVTVEDVEAGAEVLYSTVLKIANKT
ncbi:MULTISPECIES: allantoate amidohydrolase [Bacillus]|uniref:allantoate amidohydrolase n=1 Tax=Bacillus TaxID=1386 RepID=UPI000364E7D2|nr:MULTISPECIES: allantoate amidohydrolase [Bacillus]